MRLLLCGVLASAVIAPSLAQVQVPSSPIASAGSVPSGRPSDPVTARTWARFATMSAAAIKRAAVEPAVVPEALQGLPELSFSEFFGPIGAQGLEYSEKIRALAGQRVRVHGFMVQQSERVPALFLFAGMPVKVDTRADCNETDTPPAMIHVLVPGGAKPLPFVPGPHVLSGILEIGAHHEIDDRISVARLTLDAGARAALFGAPAATAPLSVK
jgi:hypothetical protein